MSNAYPGSYPEKIIPYLEAGDWLHAHRWAKGWIGRGGATLPEPWLVYAATSVLKESPKSAIYSLDLGLRGWVEKPEDRSVLLAARKALVVRYRDQKKLGPVEKPPAYEDASKFSGTPRPPESTVKKMLEDPLKPQVRQITLAIINSDEDSSVAQS